MNSFENLYVATISLPDSWPFVGVYEAAPVDLDALRDEIAKEQNVLPASVDLTLASEYRQEFKPPRKLKDWTPLVKMRNVSAREYELLTESKVGWNHENEFQMASLTDDVLFVDSSRHVTLGGWTPDFGDEGLDTVALTEARQEVGLRPVFEAMNPNDCADVKIGDVVVIGTLYVGTDPVKVPSNPVSDEYGGNLTHYCDNKGAKITLGKALDDRDYQMMAVYVGNGVFVCDRCMLNWISYEDISKYLA